MGMFPTSEFPEEWRFLPESNLELALLEYFKWLEASEEIILSHQPIKCRGLNREFTCEICKARHGDSEHGKKVAKYYRTVIRDEPLWQDLDWTDDGFDPMELDARIIVNKLLNPDDPFEKSHDAAYAKYGSQIVKDSIRRSIDNRKIRLFPID